MKTHPVAEIFPMMTKDELNDLATDIKINGLLTPIVTDSDGDLLIDGRNRLAACKIAGVKPEFTKLNGHDPVAFILSSNIARRHMSKGQQAMAVAMIYPEPDIGHSRKKGVVSKIEPRLVHPGSLSQARTVLANLPEVAKQVLAGDKALGEAYKEAIVFNEALESQETKLAQLRSAAPDLAELVTEERMKFTEAWAAFEERKTEIAAKEVNKREALLRTTESAYRGIVAWAADGFIDEIQLRLDAADDDTFYDQFVERVRFDPKELDDIQRGAKALAKLLGTLKKGKR